MNEIKSEAKLTFAEATSIIIGHGVGSGILAVPFLASRNRIIDIVIILLLAYLVNLLMHLMIAELSYNNKGAQLIKCLEHEVFKGKIKNIASWFTFILLGFSVIVNVSGFIVGASDVFQAWFGISPRAGMILYYILASTVVLFGMKLVGVCEKLSVALMVGVMLFLFIWSVASGAQVLPNTFYAHSNWIILYSIVSFSLSAVMSVPQAVKGLGGDAKKIKASIALGTGVNLSLIFLITITTFIGVGEAITRRGALVDLADQLGGFVSIIGYVFSLLALSTSFWANTLNLRDVIDEQAHVGPRISWAISTLPCLLIALIGIGTFVGFVRLASVIQVLTGIGIIVAYNKSRRSTEVHPICGKLGSLPFQLLVVISSILATAGALVKIV